MRVRLWFHQWLTCCIVFYCSTNVYVSWRLSITSRIAIMACTLTVFLGSKHSVIQIQMKWNWMDVIHELTKLCCFLSKQVFLYLCIHCLFLFICLVTHTSQSCLHGCLRCWARPLPSSSVFTPCFRMKFRSWWVKMFACRVWTFETLKCSNISSGLPQFHIDSLVLKLIMHFAILGLASTLRF